MKPHDPNALSHDPNVWIDAGGVGHVIEGMDDAYLSKLFWWLRRQHVESGRGEMTKYAEKLEQQALVEEATYVRWVVEKGGTNAVRAFFYPQWRTVVEECRKRG